MQPFLKAYLPNMLLKFLTLSLFFSFCWASERITGLNGFVKVMHSRYNPLSLVLLSNSQISPHLLLDIFFPLDLHSILQSKTDHGGYELATKTKNSLMGRRPESR